MHVTNLRILCVLVAATVYGVAQAWECESVPCECKWVSGKKTADCVNHNLTKIPDFLSELIQDLELEGNRIKHLRKDAFFVEGLVDLHKVGLQHCGIETVHQDAFNGLSILIAIDLTGNRITNLHAETFLPTPRLRVLVLNENQIDTLEDNLFHGLTFLQRVGVAGNKLKRISNTTFANLPALRDVDLGGNRLTNLKLESFDGSLKLASIKLLENPWNCDCNLKDFFDWSLRKNISSEMTTCEQPLHLANKSWEDMKSTDFACRPEILAAEVEVSPGDVTLLPNMMEFTIPKD